MSLLERDEAAGELHHGEVVRRDAFPTDQDTAIAIVPAVGALDDPTPRFAAHASDQWLLAATTNVRDDASTSDSSFAVGVVVAFVQAEMTWATRTEQSAKHDGVEHVGDQPLVVHVCSRDKRGQRNAAAIAENVSFHAEFPSVRRVRPRVAPPLGALTMALSSEAKSHLMPRRLS